jgi:hypothetical protein
MVMEPLSTSSPNGSKRNQDGRPTTLVATILLHIIFVVFGGAPLTDHDMLAGHEDVGRHVAQADNARLLEERLRHDGLVQLFDRLDE